jgi:hypothetical protein
LIKIDLKLNYEEMLIFAWICMGKKEMYVHVYGTAQKSRGNLGAISQHHVDLKKVQTPYRYVFQAVYVVSVISI